MSKRFFPFFVLISVTVCSAVFGTELREEDSYLRAYKLFKQGADFYAQDDNQRAIRYLEDALTFNPHLEGARGILLIALGEEAIVSYQDGKYEIALPYLNKLLKLLPDDAEINKIYRKVKQQRPGLERSIEVVDTMERLKQQYRLDWMGYVGMGTDESTLHERLEYIETMYAAYTGTIFGTRQIKREMLSISIERKKLLARRSSAERLSHALELYQQGRLREAIEVWDNYLDSKKDPYVEKYRNEALTALEGIIRKKLKQGSSLEDAGTWDKAVEKWKEVLSLDPYELAARTGITGIHADLKSMFNAGVEMYKQEKYLQAVSRWKEVDELYPGYRNVDLYIKKAHIKIRKTKDESNILLVKTYIKNGDDMQKKGWFQRAVTSWRQALSVDPRNKTASTRIKKLLTSLGKRAKDNEKIGNTKRAEQIWKLIVSIEPSYKRAKKKLTRIVKRSSVNINAFLAEGENAYNEGNYEQALKAFNKVLKSDRKNTRAKKLAIECALSQGILYYRSDKLKKAIQQWEYVLAYAPDHAKAGKYKERAALKLQSIDKLKK